MLNKSQQNDFSEQGFVVLPDAFSRKQISQLISAITQTVERFDPEAHQSIFSTGDRDAGRDEVFFRSAQTVEYFLEEGAITSDGVLTRPLDQAINKIGHALHDHIPAIRSFCQTPGIGQAFRQLGLNDPLLWQTMVIFKQPGIGGEVRWHQDASYLHTKPASVIGLWIALEDADRDNGCLMVAPGAHRQPLRERYTVDWNARAGSLESLNDTPWPADDEAFAVEVPAGSAVFFSDHLPHGSSANRSSRSRTALTLHAADGRSEWGMGNWIQRPALSDFRL